MQRKSADEIFDPATVKRLAKSDELDKFTRELIDGVDMKDMPALLQLVPSQGLVPNELLGVAGRLLESEPAQEMMARLKPLDTPQAKEAARAMLVGEMRKWLARGAEHLETKR
jgi:hypothetical protein